MESTPKSLRMQIGLFGRTNVGKSSFLNMIAAQDIAIVSHQPGTTTDVVEKPIELLPIGPVIILDTAGIDDTSVLSGKRIQRTLKVFDRADLVVLIIEPNIWTDFEEEVVGLAKKQDIPVIIAINKIDIQSVNPEFFDSISSKSPCVISCSSIDIEKRNEYINNFKNAILKILPDKDGQSLPLLGDLVPPGGIVVLIIPIDLQAPKGRLILPQVQAIRDLLDNDAIALVVKDREFAYALTTLKRDPDLVICDSQVVMKMVADTPPHIKCTTFSILFSRFKGNLVEEVHGAVMINKINKGDKILIAEACSHHPLQDDIGRVKIPRWLRQYLGEDVQIDFSAGRDYPANINEYKLVIHCGGCMLTRTEKLNRIQKAQEAGVAITNYGLTISFVQGVLKRVLSPFPAALEQLEIRN